MVEPSERSVELILPTCPPQDEGATHHLVDLRPPYLKMWDGTTRCRWLLRVRKGLSLEGEGGSLAELAHMLLLAYERDPQGAGKHERRALNPFQPKVDPPKFK